MRVFFVILCCQCFLVLSSFAQGTLDSAIVQLQEVPVYAEKIKPSLVGSKLIYPSKNEMELYANGQMSELLPTLPSIHMKTYGNGMLSSIAFRGTNANQTAVHWNNFNINNYTLGQVDFSTLPVVAIDQLVVIPGSGSAFGGSGAIGGTISLQSQLAYEKDFQLALNQSFGSFGKSVSTIELITSNTQLSSKTRLYRAFVINDFYVNETSAYQENASFGYHGFNQDLGFKINENNELTFSIWYNQNERDIQQPLGNRNKTATQEDENIRAALNYVLDLGNWTSSMGTAYFYDRMLFQEGMAVSNYLIQRSESFFEISQRESDLLQWTLFSRLNHIVANSEGFETSLVKEDRLVYGAKLQGALFSTLDYAINLRQELVSNTDYKPFTPYLGLQLPLLDSDNWSLTAKASSSYNYRVPTLNDRFWQIDERAEILPERGFNNEFTLAIKKSHNEAHLKGEVTAYYNDVKNFIQWVPFNGTSRPENVDEVLIKGFESQLATYFNIQDKAVLNSEVAYSYTKSEPLIDGKPLGLQLRYVPKNKVTSTTSVELANMYLTYQYLFTGEVFDTENNSSTFAVAPYHLHHLSYGIRAGSIQASLAIKNLFNEQYQTYLNYATPGRHYEFSINYTLKK